MISLYIISPPGFKLSSVISNSFRGMFNKLNPYCILVQNNSSASTNIYSSL